MTRWTLGLAVASVGLAASLTARAQEALPTPEAYQQAQPAAGAPDEGEPGPAATPAAGTSAAGTSATAPSAALPPPPSVAPELDDPAATPEGYDAYRRSSPGSDDVRLDVLDYGNAPFRLFAERLDFPTDRRELCTTPCTVRLAPGTYRMSVAPMGGGPREADGPSIRLPRDRRAILNTHYDHRTGLRTVGFTLLHVGLSAFGMSFIGGPVIALIIGLPLAVAFFIAAAPFMFLTDSARVELFVPPPELAER